MKKIINAVIGDPKTASPARKYAAYALLGTVAALVLALVILIVSSIAFNIADGNNAGASQSGDGGADVEGGVANKGTITYNTSISADDLDAMVDGLVDFTDKTDRTITSGTNDLYYAKNKVDKLTKGCMNGAHAMFVDFYNNNKSALNPDVGSNSDNADCTIPLVVESTADGMSFKVVVFGNDANTYQNSTYKWLYDNAHLYGFITEENTFTYVGVAAANYIKKNEKAVADYDAFINVLKNNTKSNTSVTVNKVTYQMYYLAADGELKVPTNYEYTVMADGTDGYIIIVDMSKKVQTTETETSDGGVG